MHRFPGLIARHRVDPGHLVHAGVRGREAVPFYHEAGYTRITVIEPAPGEAWVLRSQFPSVDVIQGSCSPAKDNHALRLDAAAPRAHAVVVNDPGSELAVLAGVPWDTLDLLIVNTSTSDVTEFASAYDLVTEVVTTRGFVEVDRWTRDTDGTLDAVFMKGARL